LGSKLEACTRGLTAWRKKWSGNKQASIFKIQKSLLKLQTREDGRAENAIKKVQNELGQMLEKEEIWWRQGAKEEWLKSGDRNTRFFHACASARQRRNYVRMIKDENGLTWDTPGEVDKAFVRYFSHLFTKGLDGNIKLYIQPITSCVIA
jgi:hypothetical protein